MAGVEFDRPQLDVVRTAIVLLQKHLEATSVGVAKDPEQFERVLNMMGLASTALGRLDRYAAVLARAARAAELERLRAVVALAEKEAAEDAARAADQAPQG